MARDAHQLALTLVVSPEPSKPHEKNETVIFKTEEIIYLERSGRRKVKIVTIRGTSEVRTEWNTICEMLEPFDFALSHQGFIVNLIFIERVKGYSVKMINGDTIPIAQGRKKAFWERFTQLLAELN